MIPAIEPLYFHAAAPHDGRPIAFVGGDLMALLQHFDCGAIVLDGAKDIIAFNDAARRLLEDGLSVTRNRLRVSSPGSQSDLDALLHDAFIEPTRAVKSMVLPRPSGERPFILRALPLAKGGGPKGEPAKASLVLLLVFVAEPRITTVPGESLRALGLTRAETDVGILLGAGLSPREVSERLDIKIATVRTHLKRIFQKLGLCRQSELVQLVTRLSFIR
jgi:DNA-binding CsgD family transcriptional regulator